MSEAFQRLYEDETLNYINNTNIVIKQLSNDLYFYKTIAFISSGGIFLYLLFLILKMLFSDEKMKKLKLEQNEI